MIDPHSERDVSAKGMKNKRKQNSKVFWSKDSFQPFTLLVSTWILSISFKMEPSPQIGRLGLEHMSSTSEVVTKFCFVGEKVGKGHMNDITWVETWPHLHYHCHHQDHELGGIFLGLNFEATCFGWD